MSIKMHMCGTSAAALVATMGGSGAYAQTPTHLSSNSASTLEEVIVTARRVSENIQSVPVAVTAISGAAMRERNIFSVPDLQRVTPSLGITTTTRGSGTPIYMIRGQRAFSPNVLSEPAVTVYFGEVGQSIPTGTSLSLYDLQSAQVLKGPQGTLFGRNTTGGAVLFTPNAPTSDFEGYAQVTGGSYDLRDFEGVLNVPASDQLQIRAAGKITRRDGYLSNPVRGDKAGDQYANSGRLSIRWGPSSQFETTTLLTYFNDDVQDALKLDRVNPAGVPALPIPGATAIVQTQIQTALTQMNRLGKYEFNDITPEKTRDQVYGAQNITTLELGSGSLDSLSLKNIFGYRSVLAKFHYVLDGSPLGLIYYPPAFNARISAKQVSDEFQVIGTSGNLDFIAGVFYYYMKGNDKGPSFQFTPLATALGPPFNAAFPSVSVQAYESRNKSYAGFFHLNYKLDSVAEGLSLSGGARYTRDERGIIFSSRTAAGFNPTAFRCTLTAVTGLPDSNATCAVPAEVSFGRPTWDASINYQANPDLLVYLAHRHGYRSGGWSTSPTSIAAIPDFQFKPEIVDDIELGVKSEFSVGEMSGRVNLAVYHSAASNVQRTTNRITAAGAITSQVLNAAKARVNGGEIEVTLKPTESLTLAVNGALIDAKYKKWNDVYLIGTVPTVVDISDSKFAYVPKTQINASVSYQLPIDEAHGKLSVLASYYYQSKVYTQEITTANCGPNGLYKPCLNSGGGISGYSLVNMRGDWRNVAGKGFDLAVFVTNVTDKYYKPTALNALAVLGTFASNVAPPRMWGVELRAPFGASGY